MLKRAQNQQTALLNAPVAILAEGEQEGHGADPVAAGLGREAQEEADSQPEPEGVIVGFTPQEVRLQQEADDDLKDVKRWKETRAQCPS